MYVGWKSAKSFYLRCESSTLMKATVARMSNVATINNWNSLMMRSGL